MTAKVISIANHKGGVGKTTTAATLGSILARRGKRVLLIDLDGQANLTYCFMQHEPQETICSPLLDKRHNLPIVQITDNLHLCPADLDLAYAEMQMVTRLAREKILTALICNPSPCITNEHDIPQPPIEYYDYIFIDCPPSLGILTFNAIAASNEVLIPVVAEILPVKGLTRILQAISEIQKSINCYVGVGGIILTRWERTNHAQEIESMLRNESRQRVFYTKIRKNTTLASSPAAGVNVLDVAPTCHGVIDYQLLAAEMFPDLFTAEEIQKLNEKK